MPCEWVKLPGGGVAHVRTSGRKPKFCPFCKERPATKLCDFRIKVGDVGHTRTCDAPICEQCATIVGPDRDYCPVHKGQ